MSSVQGKKITLICEVTPPTAFSLWPGALVCILMPLMIDTGRQWKREVQLLPAAAGMTHPGLRLGLLQDLWWRQGEDGQCAKGNSQPFIILPPLTPNPLLVFA